MLRDERCERSHRAYNGEEDLEERVERCGRIFHAQASCAFQSFAVEANVPVRQVIDDLQQSRDNGVYATPWKNVRQIEGLA